MDKFLGVGLKTAFMLAIFTIFVILAGKAIFTRWEIKGLTEFFHAI